MCPFSFLCILFILLSKLLNSIGPTINQFLLLLTDYLCNIVNLLYLVKRWKMTYWPRWQGSFYGNDWVAIDQFLCICSKLNFSMLIYPFDDSFFDIKWNMFVIYPHSSFPLKKKKVEMWSWYFMCKNGWWEDGRFSWLCGFEKSNRG